MLEVCENFVVLNMVQNVPADNVFKKFTGNTSQRNWGGFLIRRSSAIRRFFARFSRCDSHTIMKSFLKKIACEFTGNLHKNCMKFPENLRAIFLRNDFSIVRLSHLEKPANRRGAPDEKSTPGL